MLANIVTSKFGASSVLLFIIQMSKIIALIDCNNFYVSCERVFNPNLNHQPVIVYLTMMVAVYLVPTKLKNRHSDGRSVL